ncbi:unnamed protein product [Durusdinium trenchii]
MKGLKRDHLLGAKRLSSTWSVRNLTGQSTMFWIDLLCLDCAAWYVDVLLDIKQLMLFVKTGMVDYMAFNLTGMMLPVILSLQDIWAFHAHESPDLDALQAVGLAVGVPLRWLQASTMCAVLLQLQMLWLTIWSAKHRLKHPLLGATKFAEVAESATSALVQCNFLICTMVGVKDFAALQLDAKDLTWLCASITMSCCMLGLGFASRDTSTSRVLGVPGKLKKDQEPLLVLAIVMLRSAEVICQVFAINFFHVSARWQGFALGGPILTMGLAMMAKCLLRKASVADVLAAVIAHPGQLLEPTSLFPLQSTMKIKMLSVTAVVASQAFARYASASEHAKAIPDWLLAAWLGLSAVSWMGLGLVARLGEEVKHTSFHRLASLEGRVTYSAVKTALACTDEVPLAVLMALTHDCILSLDGGAEHLVSSDAWAASKLKLGSTFFSKIGNHGTRQVLISLSNQNPEDLDLSFCHEIPTDAWEVLETANWSNLKKASFEQCFYDNTKGAEGAKHLLKALAQSAALEDLNLSSCHEIPSDAWEVLQTANWSNLKKAFFQQCFNVNTKGAEGAKHLLKTLAQSTSLEDLDLSYCDQIPSNAWEELPSAIWSNLKKASFEMSFNANKKGAEGAKHLLKALAQSAALEDLNLSYCDQITSNAWEVLQTANWSSLKKAFFQECFNVKTKGAEGAKHLLKALAQSATLEDLDLSRCGQIRRDSWQVLQTSNWWNLKKADFAWCFYGNTKGAEGAKHLLKALAQCAALEDLNLSGCNQIPSDAWEVLRTANWSNLQKAFFQECFNVNTEGAEGAKHLLKALAQCAALEDLDLSYCDQIPGDAWEALQTANWSNLKKAFFDMCFYERTKGAEGAKHLLKALAQSAALEDLGLSYCDQIPSVAWEVLQTTNWSKLKKASFEQCFDDNTKGAEGAKHLLKALAQSAALEELDLTDCSQIPSDAWGVLQTHPGLWPCLRKSFGIPEQVTFGPSFARGLTDFQILPRIFRSVRIPRAFSGHDRTVPFEASSLLAALAQSAALEDLNLSDCNQIPSDAWEALQTANWSNLKKASFEQCFDDNTKGAEGAKHLLKALAQSAALEDLELSFCDQIPTDAWEILQTANWSNLRKVSFEMCFYERTKGAEGAKHLIKALAQSAVLEDLNLSRCSEIPSDAWEALQTANWSNLKKASFEQCFDDNTKGAEGAKHLLKALAQSAALEDLELSFCDQIPTDAWEILQTANWSNLRKASFEQCFDDNTKGAEGAKHLLKALAQSAALEELDLTDCSQIPSDAWGALQTRPEVLWPCLRKSFGVPEQVALERGIE